MAPEPPHPTLTLTSGGMTSAEAKGQTEWLTRTQAAEAADKSPRTIDRWIASGLLPAERFGPRAVRIRRADLGALGRPIVAVSS